MSFPIASEFLRKICIIILFSFTLVFPLFKLINKVGGHPAIINVIHVITKITNIVCTSRINRSNVAVVPIAIKYGYYILGLFSHFYVFHKVIKRINDISFFFCDFSWRFNLYSLIHKIKKNDNFKSVLYVINHPVISKSCILLESSANAAFAIVYKVFVDVGNCPDIVRRGRFIESLS